jgi:hypothetical protein
MLDHIIQQRAGIRWMEQEVVTLFANTDKKSIGRASDLGGDVTVGPGMALRRRGPSVPYHHSA